MRRAFALSLVSLCACAGDPTRVRVQVALAADSQDAAPGPLHVSVYTDGGRVVDGAVVQGALPGDVVVWLDDDAGKVRVWVRVLRNGAALAAAAGSTNAVPHVETTLALSLSGSALPDLDGDGVPDSIDDCPTTSDPEQNCAAGSSKCGNGTLDPGEACDEGSANSDRPDEPASCSTACQRRAPCGTVAGAKGAVVDPGTGHCYVAWSTSLNFTAAETDCNSRGGHLAAPTSEAERARVQSLLAGQTAWIGLVVEGAAPPWTFTSGESSSDAPFSNGVPTGARTCVVTSATGTWEGRRCGWPSSGDLPPSPPSTNGFVCEHACGNGVVEPGEECDPPGSTCTEVCRNKRPCTEPGGVVSATSGRCYFKTSTAQTYDSAFASGCPAGTHLATPVGPADTEAARLATDADAWLAVRALATVGEFAFEGTTEQLDASRYHGFATNDPEYGAVPACVVMSHLHMQGDGWRDRPCTDLYASLCERD